MRKTPSSSSIFSKVELGNKSSSSREQSNENFETPTEKPPLPPKKAKRVCHFNNDWMREERYSSWLQPTPDDPLSATCTLCYIT